MAKVGDSFTYRGSVGFGELAAGRPLSSDMADLDLQPNATVEVAAVTDDGVVIVKWVDRQLNTRHTSVQPSVFAKRFKR
jgi:hypothetical protein